MVKFTSITPSATGGGGRAAGDKDKWKDGSTTWIRCYICGFLVDSEAYDTCPSCESDNYRGLIRKK